MTDHPPIPASAGPDPAVADDVAARSIGRRRFLQGVGASAGAAAIGSALSLDVGASSLPAGVSRFVALPKAERVVDTRTPEDYDFERLAADRIRIQVRDRFGVPANAAAVVLTVTGKNFGTANNYVTVFPTGLSKPDVSNLNLPVPFEVTANLAFVKVGSSNSVDVDAFHPCDMIVDLLGYFEPVSGPVSAGRFVGLDTAARALDTRPNFVAAGSFTTVDLTAYVPANAASAIVNLTSLSNTGTAFFTALPASVTTTPRTSSLNVVRPGDKRAAAVIVPVETVNGRRIVRVYASGAAKLICDVTGYFTAESGVVSQSGLFVPTNPDRVLDTRVPDPVKRLWPGWVRESKLPSPVSTAAAAVVLNVTSARTRGEGYLTVSPARRPIPPTSNANWVTAEATVPNLAITPVTATHGFQVFDSSGGHVMADLAGYFTGTQRAANVPTYVNPEPPPIGPTWTLHVPRIGLTSTVMAGSATAVTDSGRSWHWEGTGYLGQDAHVGAFAHRTSAGGPYRYLHLLQVGDTWTLTTADRREFTYRMVRRDLTDANPTNILNATRFHPGRTFSMIACTKTNWQPTSLSWRIVVTGELVSWREF